MMIINSIYKFAVFLKTHRKKSFILTAALLAAGCRTLPDLTTADYAANFFPAGAPLYLSIRGRELPLKKAAEYTKSAHVDFLTTLLQRSDRALFYTDDAFKVSGYLTGSFPKGFIENFLDKDIMWQRIDDTGGFKGPTYGVELSIPQSGHILMTQNSLKDLLAADNPNIAAVIPSYALKAMNNNQLTLYAPDAAGFLKRFYTNMLPNIAGLDSFMLTLTKEKPSVFNLKLDDDALVNHYMTALIVIKADSPVMARAFSAVLRSVRMLLPVSDLMRAMEIEISGSDIYLFNSVSKVEVDFFLATLLDRMAVLF
jgi:hypothetical protein